jgi:hypothetical protein
MLKDPLMADATANQYLHGFNVMLNQSKHCLDQIK